MNSTTEANPLPRAEGGLAQLGGRLIQGAVSLFGISGIFYGAGFLALRSHFAFLGIWSGVPSNASLVGEEGGRFFFHLIFLPAGIITRLFTDLHLGLSYGLAFVLLAALLWDRRRWVYYRFRKNPKPQQVGLGRRLFAKSPAFCLTACLVVTSALLITQWQVMSLQDVVRGSGSISEEVKIGLKNPTSVYNIVVVELFAVIIVAWLLYDVAWSSAPRPGRVMIAAQWLLVLAALATLPAVYGRLILPTTYPVFSFSGASSDERLLIQQTPDAWILWNTVSKQTEIIPKDKAVSVSVGARKSLI
jgi:hypothetical protein